MFPMREFHGSWRRSLHVITEKRMTSLRLQSISDLGRLSLEMLAH